MIENMLANAGDAKDTGSIFGSGRSLGGGNGNPLQYFCLGNPMDREAWWVTVHVVAKSWTWLILYDRAHLNSEHEYKLLKYSKIFVYELVLFTEKVSRQ